MHQSTDVFPRTPVQITGQDLVSHAGVKPLTSFIDALGVKRLGEEHLGSFVPGAARHRPGTIIASLVAIDQDGNEREGAWVVNATEVIGLKDYPVGTNLYLRAEPLHPGARATLLDHEGMRITAFLCNSPRWDAQELDVRHRRSARCENRIKTLKNTGLGKL